MNMPCSFAGQSKPLAVSGPPHDWTTSPSLLNCTTEGAVKQHLDLSPRCARLSRSFTVRGRWLIQTESSLSTKMPPIWPKIQFFGRGLGQDVSIWNFGASAAKTEPDIARATIPAVAMMRPNRAISPSFVLSQTFLDGRSYRPPSLNVSPWQDFRNQAEPGFRGSIPTRFVEHDIHVAGERSSFSLAKEGLDPVQKPIGEDQQFAHFR